MLQRGPIRIGLICCDSFVVRALKIFSVWIKWRYGIHLSTKEIVTAHSCIQKKASSKPDFEVLLRFPQGNRKLKPNSKQHTIIDRAHGSQFSQPSQFLLPINNHRCLTDFVSLSRSLVSLRVSWDSGCDDVPRHMRHCKIQAQSDWGELFSKQNPVVKVFSNHSQATKRNLTIKLKHLKTLPATPHLIVFANAAPRGCLNLSPEMNCSNPTCNRDSRVQKSL